MIVKKNILSSLKKLDILYNISMTSTSHSDSVFYSRLAVLELGSWLEESFDDIVARSLKGKLKTVQFKDILRGYIKATHGFKYKKHFRPLMIRAIGLYQMEKIHNYLDSSGQLQILESTLDTISDKRNPAAHTSFIGTPSYPAPSTTLGQLDRLYPILRNIYSFVTKL
jgi:hypothetical protein